MPVLVSGFFAPFLNVEMKCLDNDFGLFLVQSYCFRKPGMSHINYFHCAFFLVAKPTTIL